jgi:hypothetical protein
MTEFKLPTETVDLPSMGLHLYPREHALSSGKVEIKYMTAKEEDILSNPNYLRDGTSIDRLLKSLVVTEFNFDDLLIGDKNAIMIASRILAYGKDYEFDYEGEKQVVDLSTFNSKELDKSLYSAGLNAFSFELPNSKNKVVFKLLTHGDEKALLAESESLKKINKSISNEATSRLARMITSVNGTTGQEDIRNFVNNYLLASDARALRKYYQQVSPDVDLTTTLITKDGSEVRTDLPIGISFFWPDL